MGRGTGLPGGHWSGSGEAVPCAAPCETGRGLSQSSEYLRGAPMCPRYGICPLCRRSQPAPAGEGSLFSLLVSSRCKTLLFFFAFFWSFWVGMAEMSCAGLPWHERPSGKPFQVLIRSAHPFRAFCLPVKTTGFPWRANARCSAQRTCKSWS